MATGRCAARAFAALCALAALPAAAQIVDNPATEIEGSTVEVIGTVPVPGLGTPLREIPATVQSVGAEELRNHDARDITEHFERSFTGVNLNSAQGNPFQQDLLYRGFTASPLLGVPQGLSVFVDGIRVNEAFGDTVNWDLIPRNAISTVHLLSASNPVFGLNTLGGVLSIQTKSGFAFPGTAARLAAGAFGRRSAEVEHGGHGENADWFVAVNAHDEAGWREHSPSSIRQAFIKGGWQDSRTDIDVSLALADNTLQGTQALPLSMFGNPRQAYTWPDRTENALSFLTLRASRYVENDILLAGSAYLRNLHQSTLSSNVDGDFDPTLAVGPGNAQGFNDRTTLDQTMAGASLQLSMDGELGVAINRLTLGASLDRASSDFAQSRQEATVSTERSTIGFGAFARQVSVAGDNTYFGAYFSDQLALSQNWIVTASGRYNIARISLRDRSGSRSALDGDHVFQRFNPALGVNWNPTRSATYFTSLSQGMRVPSPVELTCADPAAPCALPNQFLTDPALKPVIARTTEVGTRLRFAENARVTASGYRTVLTDDILFVSSGSAVNTGFFQNVGKTLREGFDLGAKVEFGDVALKAGYSYVRAEYLTAFRMLSPNNSSRNAANQITVDSGNRLSGIPRSSLKLFADWTPSPRWSVGFGWAWFDKQYARGDENNRDVNGPLPSYGVAQLFGQYAINGNWKVSVKMDNLFNHRYENFGILGRNFFTGLSQSFDAAGAAPEQFRSPGAPRAVWVALRYELDAKVRH
jgi:outer membrane receptor protein involved in Fe transport